MAQIPQIVQSPLSGQWYVVTKYRLEGAGVLIASVKHDVTDQMKSILKRHLRAAKKS